MQRPGRASSPSSASGGRQDSLWNDLEAGIEGAGYAERPRSATLDLYDWSIKHRIINGQSFTIIPPFRAIYESQHPRLVIRKAAQVFVSEFLVNTALWVPDTRAGGRGNALYVFPKAEQGDDFSRARIEKAIDESPHLKGQLGSPANVRQKRIGPGYLYVRGAQNRDQLISVDADAALCDEIAQYSHGTIDLITKRLGSSLLGWIRAGSTPRFPSDEAGVLWDQSTQSVYEVRCSHCGTWQHLDVETHLDPQTARVACTHCHGDMRDDRLGEGHWVSAAAVPAKDWQGYQLTKLLSPRVNLADLAATYRKVLEGRATQTEIQEFYNSDAGKAHLPEGGYIGAGMLDACIDPEYELPETARGALMGVDVGSRLHVVILVRDDQRLRLVYADSVRTFDELHPLMQRYTVARCVVDANPETRTAQTFAGGWKGRVYLAYYPNFAEGQRGELVRWEHETREVKINRTVALDAVLALVSARDLILPRNARELGGAVDKAGLGEFYRHLGASVRVVSDDARGNPVAHYEQNGADHFGHAMVYARIAAEQQHAVTAAPRGLDAPSTWRAQSAHDDPDAERDARPIPRVTRGPRIGPSSRRH